MQTIKCFYGPQSSGKSHNALQLINEEKYCVIPPSDNIYKACDAITKDAKFILFEEPKSADQFLFIAYLGRQLKILINEKHQDIVYVPTPQIIVTTNLAEYFVKTVINDDRHWEFIECSYSERTSE